MYQVLKNTTVKAILVLVSVVYCIFLLAIEAITQNGFTISIKEAYLILNGVEVDFKGYPRDYSREDVYHFQTTGILELK